jgi:hypothetical protein
MQNMDDLGWIFPHDGAAAHGSQGTLDWLEESVDVIVDWSANSPNFSPLQLLWALLKNLAREIAPRTVEELRNAVLASWALLPSVMIDKLCLGFRVSLELCLAKAKGSISNDLWQISERGAIKDFLEGTRVHVPWTETEGHRLMHDWLVVAVEDAKRWTVKNRWYQVLRHRIQGRLMDTENLARFLQRNRTSLPVPHF